MATHPETKMNDRPIHNQRRLAISGPEVSLGCVSMPRMVRRGAISYNETDATAQYIRFLGDAMCNQLNQNVKPLPATPNLNQLLSRRRGSLRAPAFSKAEPKEPILQSVNVEVHLQDNLSKVNSWSFDVFTFKTVTEGRPLFHLGLHLLQQHNLIALMSLDIMQVMRFLAFVEQSYHPENCYHNSTHAADVTQALNCLLCEPKLLSKLTPAELLAALLAAMCHDMDHPGVNQSYLINTSSHLAYIHGSTSVLEHHHCRQAKAILKETRLLDHLPAEERQEIVSLIESMILATDVSHHAVFLNKFKDTLKSSELMDLDKKENRHFMLTIAIKAADISNPARSFTLSKVWSEHIMEEFFKQGDMEREQNLPISSYCDRYTTVIPISQKSFFTFVCAPLFDAWYQFFGSQLAKHLCENIEKNKAYWESKEKEIEAVVRGQIGATSFTPPSKSEEEQVDSKEDANKEGGSADTEPLEAAAVL